jgi:hypothetical protein
VLRLGNLPLWLCIAVLSIAAGTFLAILFSRSAELSTAFILSVIAMLASGLGVLLLIDLD